MQYRIIALVHERATLARWYNENDENNLIQLIVGIVAGYEDTPVCTYLIIPINYVIKFIIIKNILIKNCFFIICKQFAKHKNVQADDFCIEGSHSIGETFVQNSI